MIYRVQQEDIAGCIIAALAMATGRTYQAVRSWFVNPDLQKFGLTYLDAHAYLGEHGYAVIHKWKHLAARASDRAPWPPGPFAPIHICGVRTSGEHAVTMLADGTVLDPAREGQFRLNDYSATSWITGIFDERSVG